MSWDAKALLVLMLIWAFIAAIFVPVLGMVEGARGWGVGAGVFLILFLWLVWAEGQSGRDHEEDPQRQG
ncbi:hypothetical protein [Marinithermus hydrothermalis]|uniref:Uncharacterized protein n=1 Tax=Marinithermus hydrothermalis (strain DSM 14884 / JCM 11576 / T1) TaxID=869210 RepID=F2NPF4_MARHT|nr:hypothetical protein [Marinithermus hydrothermalis]AEB12235.1 hypothetical protein Marky_1500 [Marinithermus hydrothermalis DSM 14884]